MVAHLHTTPITGVSTLEDYRGIVALVNFNAQVFVAANITFELNDADIVCSYTGILYFASSFIDTAHDVLFFDGCFGREYINLATYNIRDEIFTRTIAEIGEGFGAMTYKFVKGHTEV